MNNYVILIVAFIIGQCLYTTINVYTLQYGKNIAYWPALRTYVIKETAGYAVSMFFLFAVMFILSDYIDINKKDLLNPDTMAWKKKVLTYFRTGSLIFGVFTQALAFYAFKRGKKAIEKEEAKL